MRLIIARSRVRVSPTPRKGCRYGAPFGMAGSEGHPIDTVGYGSRSIGEFVDLLRAHGIEYLIDVRTAPRSIYRPEFSQEPLTRVLERSGIQSVFMGDTLGGRLPVADSIHSSGRVDYAKVAASESFRRGLETLLCGYHRGCCSVLMCSELKPERCHRSKLIGMVLEEEGIPVRHIDEDGKLRTSEDILVGRLAKWQGSLFGGPGSFSCKVTLRKVVSGFWGFSALRRGCSRGGCQGTSRRRRIRRVVH